MSNRRRAPRPVPLPPPLLRAFQPAVVSDQHNQGEVQMAMSHTHDQVIAMTGPRRVSGVSWTFHRHMDGITALDDLGWDDGGPEHRTSGRTMRKMLASSSDAVLILAWVDADPGWN